ncbi:MAG: methylenetetrahydrofolate reductase [Candidatus Altiarchaeota archaeon]|nr:methylenetetrahydrofolate reductase [Candidatus Altiarchaeota archaeon]
MSTLSENMGRKFVYTVETKPPHGPDLSEFMEKIEVYKRLSNKIHGVNVVDNLASRLFMSSLSSSILLKQNGVEPVMQLVCRDRNVLAMESDLIGAAAFGIQNVLVLTGDHPKSGSSDHRNVRPVYELDSTSLIKVVSLMNSGVEINGKPLNKPTEFFVGGAVSPGVKPLEPEVLKLKRKIAAGARFFQTQVVFQESVMERFLNLSDRMVGDVRGKIILGLIPVSSEKTINFLNKLPGIKVPPEISSRIKSAKDPVEEGAQITLELVDKAKSMGLAGAHIMPVSGVKALERIFNEL